MLWCPVRHKRISAAPKQQLCVCAPSNFAAAKVIVPALLPEELLYSLGTIDRGGGAKLPVAPVAARMKPWLQQAGQQRQPEFEAHTKTGVDGHD